MVNRIIQAKILKMKRRGKKKRHAQRGVVNGSKQPNPIYMEEYRNRVRSLQDPDLIEVINKRFPLQATPPGQVEAQAARYRQLMATPEMMCFTLVKTPVRCVRLFFNAPKTIWMFQEESFILGTIRRSVEYGNKARALDRYEKNKIIWVEKSDLPKK